MADYSRPTDITSAELIDVGTGQTEADYNGKDVAGKVVLASGTLATVVEQAVWKRSALGIVHFTMSRSDLQDQIPWERIPVENADKTKKGTFAFVLSQREGKRLRAELAAAKSPYRIRARVESSFREPASQAIVEAVIRGTSIHDQAIVLTGHLQEERFSANDDGSGCANVLEIARALKRMIDDGRLARPSRDIRFWWVNEIAAEEQYFADHPDERRRVLVNINQDMVGARQSAGSRVQFVTRPPASRASFLGDVVESVVESLVEGNTAYLAAVQARQLRPGGESGSGGGAATEDQPFSRPILSRLGTRERYDARVVPFHNNTDHQAFNMAPIGISAVTFTNWPDDYIHSSDDDLWQIDPTQLKRNAVAVAASTWFVATAGSGELPALAGQVVGRALERIGHDTRRAIELASEADGDTSLRERAIALVGEGVAREQRAVRSMAVLSSDTSASVITSALAQLPTPDAAMARVRSLLAPASSAPAPGPAETGAASRVPTFIDDVAGYLDRRNKMKRPAALHPLMAYEVLNFVDGSRTIADIFRAVAAEADAAGSWYYGTVTSEDVTSYLESAADAGIVTIAAKAPVKTSAKTSARSKGKGQ
jgi:Zn-dependent M28 family amino/carboxypeptidase